MSDPVGGAPLDELNGFFKSCVLTRCKKNVEVIRHNHKVMQQVGTFSPVMEHLGDKNFGSGEFREDRSSLPGLGGDEISSRSANVMFRFGHYLRG